MLISIVIPVYNASNYLKRCLDSIVNQLYIEMEIIIIDDFSTDDSLRILEQYEKKDKRINVLRNFKNHKAGYCRNKGIKKATGDYIWFIDADDWIEPKAIFTLIEHLNSFSKKIPLLIFGHIEHFPKVEHSILTRERLPQFLNAKENAFDNFLKLTNGYLTNPFKYVYSRDLLNKHNILFPELIYYEDILFVAKAIYYAQNVEVLPLPIYNYNCQNLNSITRTFSKEKIYDLIEIYDRLHDFIENQDALEKYNDELVIRFLIFGLSRCFEVYYNLNDVDKKDSQLKKKLQSYLELDIFSNENFNYLYNLIDEIDNKDNIIKEDYGIKLGDLLNFKTKWKYD